MDVSKTFEEFLDNLSITNREEISKRYKKITRRLNDSYYDKDSDTLNSLMIGSYGRHTAIDGVSDLDMAFELPWAVYDKFDAYETNGQSALLQEVKGYIAKTYSKTKIRGDGQVVVVTFSNYVIEVLPSFKKNDGSYTYPDSSGKGRWRNTKPKPEMKAINTLNNDSSGNLKRLCKMVRAWKNKVGAPLGGLLVDTLCYNFIKSNTYYHDKGFLYYDLMSRDFFKYLSDQSKDQEFWHAPGSNQKVFKKGNFISKAKKAHKKCLEAIEKENSSSANKIWKKVYGAPFPAHVSLTEDSVVKSYRDTEEYIENSYNIDIRGFKSQMQQLGIGRRLPD